MGCQEILFMSLVLKELSYHVSATAWSDTSVNVEKRFIEVKSVSLCSYFKNIVDCLMRYIIFVDPAHQSSGTP